MNVALIGANVGTTPQSFSVGDVRVLPLLENCGNLDISTATSCGLDTVAYQTHGGSCSPL
jgi:hypothetical protein